MVVCKFFLQGTCKFGSMCRFEHEINDAYNAYQTTGSSILRNANFGSTQLVQPKLVSQEKASVDTGTLIKSVVTDMTQAEKGGQWLFSCYAPYKEKPAFPGFEDQSFEELRHGYYEAAKSSTIEQFKQQVQGMVQQVLMKVRSLQNPSPDIVTMLISIYNTPASAQAGMYSGNTQTNNSSNFSFKSGSISQQSTSIFAQANQNPFGNSQPQNSFNPPANNAFGGNSQNLFANQPNVSSTQAPTSARNIFAPTNTNQQINNPIFNQPLAGPTNTGSIFPVNTPQTNTIPVKPESIFSNNSNMFAPQNNVFQPVAQAPLFGQISAGVTTPIFNQPLNTQFAQPQNQIPQTSTFANSNSVMAATRNETPQAYSSNVFGIAGSNAPGNIDQSFYSKIEDLTEKEIKWFQSDDLDMSQIPKKPPTYEMCFKI